MRPASDFDGDFFSDGATENWVRGVHGMNTDMQAIFGPEGPFAKTFPDYEVRPGQEDLARRVWDLCESSEGGILAAEAPTGIGKSFALLVPALLWAQKRDARILFLTAGIPLQEQLRDKDLPSLFRVLGFSVPFVVLKGRGRYVCRRRAFDLGGPEGFVSFNGDAGVGVETLLHWLSRTETGELDELGLPGGHPLFAAAAAQQRGCLGARCPERERCFVLRAFRLAQDARLVIANYHLFFAYTIGLGVPFPVSFNLLVCDEAHRMTDSARSAASRTTSLDEWRRLLGGRAVTSALFSLTRSGRNGEAVLGHLGTCNREIEVLFGSISFRYGAGKTFFTADPQLVQAGRKVCHAVTAVLRPLAFLDDMEGDEISEERATLAAWRDELKEALGALSWCLAVENYPEWAYWWDGTSLQSAPTLCSEQIREGVERCAPHAVVVASATLSLAGDLRFWKRETGLEPTDTLVLESPFPLREQMEVWVISTGMAVPDPGYDQRVAEIVEKLVEQNGGSTLVLLSSLRLLRTVGERLTSRKRGYDIFLQGSLPRGELLRRFREDLASVLVGSVSFREGIDVPGSGLTQVIIDRIPFPHPNDPVVEARNRLEGNSSFRDVTLPWAKLLLKQAVGRLIRTRTDRGRVVILDGRVVERKDWKILDALPRVVVRPLRVRIRS